MQKKNHPNFYCIKQSKLLSICDDKWRDFILENSNVYSIKKKQYVFAENEQVQGTYFVCKGLIKVFKNGFGDKSYIIRFSKKGEIIGHRGWNKEFMPISAVALEDSEILFIGKEEFSILLDKIPKLTYEFLVFLSDELFQSEIKMKNLSLFNVYEKLADSLLSLENEFGKNKKGQIKVFLNRRDLADYSGVSEKLVSKILSEWANENILKLDKKAISINNKLYLQELLKGKIIHQ